MIFHKVSYLKRDGEMIAGRAVINAAGNGISFPLKKRDLLLDYIVTLMGLDDDNDIYDSSIELLHTQVCLLYFLVMYN